MGLIASGTLTMAALLGSANRAECTARNIQLGPFRGSEGQVDPLSLDGGGMLRGGFCSIMFMKMFLLRFILRGREEELL